MTSTGPDSGRLAEDDGTWVVHGERTVYDSPWVAVSLVDVTLPDGTRLEHHVVRIPSDASATLVADPDRGVLLLRRHRFISDTWGWELPAGRIDPGEDPIDAAERETVEETGWRPTGLRLLRTFHPVNGISDHRFHVFLADGAVEEGPPSDPNEAAEVAWVPVDAARRLLRDGEIVDGFTLGGLSYALAVGAIGGDGPEHDR